MGLDHMGLYKHAVPVEENTSSSNDNGEASSSSASQPIPLAKELSTLLTKASTRPNQETDSWTKEIALFMTTGGEKKTTAISELANCILNIPPTSVEAERSFSASGLFLTKLRCRLADKSLDMLIFLKYYFANKAMKV